MTERNTHRKDRTNPLTYLALAAGLLVGTKIADSWYRSLRHQRKTESEREQLRRWEGEGGAVDGSAATPPAA